MCIFTYYFYTLFETRASIIKGKLFKFCYILVLLYLADFKGGVCVILNVNLWQKNVTVGFNCDPVIEVKKKVRIYLKWIPCSK